MIEKKLILGKTSIPGLNWIEQKEIESHKDIIYLVRK